MERIDDSLRNLFHQEFTKMVAVISKVMGLAHIETTEDLVSETFLTATETWNHKGLPENPTAWLYAVARQKAFYHFRRNRIYHEKVLPAIASEYNATDEMPDLDFSDKNIRDSQLQMLFAVCHPAIASEAQIGLALRVLCGFGIDEIAQAFLTSKETINKRLFRAKEKLRAENVTMELPGESEIVDRLDNVLHIVYLLFSEGYYSTTQTDVLRKDLCFEAMRLAVMLTDYHPTNVPKTNALMALMCFHASRFNARQTNESYMVLYEDQREELWDTRLIRQGSYYLNLAATGNEITSYHLEAKIASCHCIKNDTPEKWEEILQLYNQLLMVNYSPAVALNRTFALFKANGREAALAEAQKLRLENNHFYFVLLGELYSAVDKTKSKMNYEKAYALAKNQMEKEGIQEKIDALMRSASSL